MAETVKLHDLNYVFKTTVLAVEEKKRIVRGYKDDKGNEVLETETIGWFVTFEGSHESLFLGTEKPTLKKGDRIKIVISKVK